MVSQKPTGIFDFDGVLFPIVNGGSHIKQFIDLRVERLGEALGCTGRDVGFFLAAAPILGLRGGVAEHGAWFILDAEQEIIVPSPLLEGLKTGDRIPPQDFERFVKGIGGIVYPGKSICLTAYPPRWMSPVQLRDRIREEWRGYPGNITASSIAADVWPPCLDKGLALGRFPGLDLERCFGVADSETDISWLKLLGTRVAAVSNADEELKKWVDGQGGKLLSKPLILGACEAIDFFAPPFEQ